MTLVFVLTLLVGAAAGRDVATSNPLGKVIELMDGLTAKITAEGEAEAKAFKECGCIIMVISGDSLE